MAALNGIKNPKSIKLNPPQILALGYTVFILLGAILLWLPISTTKPISFLDALFTATSATTVTGLAVVDSGTAFTLFGQIIMLCLVQIGGLGFMSFAVLVIMLLGKRIGLKQRMLLQESLNHPSVGGIIRLVRMILLISLAIELVGFIFLSLVMIPKLGFLKGAYYSLFHSITAFNNAGIALWPKSLGQFSSDPIVNLVVTLLITTGGIGFTVLIDIWYSKEFHQLSLHSKLMIYGTIILNVIAILTFFVLEYNNPGTIGDMTLQEKLLSSYFQGISARTAGFGTIDYANLEPGTAITFMLMMFIGGGSGSTASGIKITTFLVIILAVVSFVRGKDKTIAFNRTIRMSTIMRSITIVFVSLTVLFVAVIALMITENGHGSFLIILFETVSAFGTTGASMGLTGELSTPGRWIIMLMMFFGRLGLLTLAFSLSAPGKRNIRYPNGDVFTG
ncbi:trk system potassium uptake protein TrkH [Scopulibacillus darangshiensis]|uniref:Trk system potassium uptake protein TrkH n=1 Tax=Scopulibacillus darangshiensis TaxID=442528 RepID=A0A4R2P6L6_9BACL|nr:TrkH family potassium uptake protein [Scopulibacillus darangshiensis]TCP30539.1 trk system potassium uptake protein TrkH [Scopulibacillus darangshiensis]